MLPRLGMALKAGLLRPSVQALALGYREPSNINPGDVSIGLSFATGAAKQIAGRMSFATPAAETTTSWIHER